MALTATEEHKQKERPLIEAGVHVGTCYMIVDVGTHHNDAFDKDAHQVVIGWEIPEQRGEFTIDGEKQSLPLVVTKTFTVSLHKKSGLRAILESWRGKPFTEDELRGFDLKNVLGKSCQIMIMHRQSGDKTYANIGAIMPLPKGMKAPKQETASQWFSLEEGTAIPDNIPGWLVEKIKTSKEWLATEAEEENDASEEHDAAVQNVAESFSGKVVGNDEELPF